MIQFLTGHGCLGNTCTYLEMVAPLNCIGEDDDEEHIVIICPRFRWTEKMTFGFNQIIGEKLSFGILWSQYRQRMAEVMLELRGLELQRRNLI